MWHHLADSLFITSTNTGPTRNPLFFPIDAQHKSHNNHGNTSEFCLFIAIRNLASMGKRLERTTLYAVQHQIPSQAK
ncbi:hypothetical protein VTL71DRAFT_9862 [Oculimacula yallundae]|uniref:Uncharacterized protein n=1 Tax=Oculimacula yallundae TaxID=86028 RepID=A0ABR4BQR1_9HELO